MNLIPYEKLAEWIRAFRIFAFDARVSWLNLLSLLCGLIMYIVLYFDNYRFYSEISIPLNPLLVSTLRNLNQSSDIQGLLYSMDTIFTQSMFARSSLQSVFIDLQTKFSNSDGTEVSRSTCDYAKCEVYSGDEDRISRLKSLIAALEHGSNEKERVHIWIPSLYFTKTTIDSLYASNWMAQNMKNGPILISLLFRNSLSEVSSYSSFFFAFEIGRAGEILKYNTKAFNFRTGTDQSLMAIFVLIFFSMSMLLYITKYFAKLNFMFSQYYLFYGIYFIGTFAFTSAVIGLQRSAMLKVKNMSPQDLSMEHLSRIYYTSNIYKLSFLFIGVTFSVELIKLLLYIRRFNRIRASTISILRTFGVLFKVLIFIFIVLLLSSWGILLFDGWSGTQEFVDIVFRYSYISPAFESYLFTSTQNNRLILMYMFQLAIFSVIFVAINNAENLE